MELDAEEHRDRRRLDRRLPEAPRALPELARRAALRALRRRELPATTSSSARRVLRAAARSVRRHPRPRSRRPATSSAPTRSSAATSGSCSLHIAGKLSGTIESAQAAARSWAATGCGRSTPRRASAAIAMLGLAIQRRLERGTSDEEVDALVERYRREARTALHRRHARVPRPRRPDRSGAALGGRAAQHQADPHHRGRRGRAGQARARKPRRRSSSSSRRFDRLDPSTAPTPAGRDRARGRARAGGCARRDGAATRGRRRRSSSSTTLGPGRGHARGPGTVGFFWFDDAA